MENRPQINRNGQDLAAQAQAAEGNRAAIATSNQDAELNAAPIGPAVAVAFISAAVKAKSARGKFLILGTLFVTNSGVDNESTFQLVKNAAANTGASLAVILGGTGTAIGPIEKACAGHVTPDACVEISWIDSGNVIGTSTTYGISAVATAGTDTIPANGAAIVIIELP